MLEAVAVTVTSANRQPAARWLYLCVAVSIIVLNVAAFGPSIVDDARRTVPLPMSRMVLAHSLVCVAWLAVFVIQIALVATGRGSIHRRLGVVGGVLAASLIVTTWLMLVETARRGFDLSGDLVATGTSIRAAQSLAAAGALVPFGVCVAVAVLYRRRPAVHRRLMMLALLLTTGAPILHIVGHWALPAPLGPLLTHLVLFVPALADRLTERRIHPVSLWGAIGVNAWLLSFFLFFANTAAWNDLAAWVIR